MSRYDNKTAKSLEELNGAGIAAPLIVDDQAMDPAVNIEMAGSFGSGSETDRALELEKFMNETVEVTILSSGAENEEPHVVFNANGRNQAFWRDTPTPCRRSILEVIARCKKTKYRQVQNAVELDRQEMIGSTTFAYPFNVVDTNPKGRAWLAAVKAEAN